MSKRILFYDTEIEFLLKINKYHLICRQQKRVTSATNESKDDTEFLTSSKDDKNVVDNPFTNDVLIECCSTIRHLCTNHNDCKTILGSVGICNVVTSIVRCSDSLPLLDMCLRLIIDLLNSVRSTNGNRISDNSDLFGEAGICEVVYRVLDDRQSSSTISLPLTADLNSPAERKLFIAACDAIANLSGSKGNCIRFGEADIPTILTNRLKGNYFSEDFISERSYELWVHVLWSIIRLCSENRAQNKSIFVREGAVELIFSKLNEFIEDLEVKAKFSRAQTFVEYSAWALNNMVFYKDENLKYMVEKVPFCGLLLGDLLELEEIGAPAKAKISLLSDKLQVLLKSIIPEVDEGVEGPPLSRRGRSRGGEGKEEEKKEVDGDIGGEEEEDEEEDWDFNDS